MSHLVFDLLLDIGRRLGEVKEGDAYVASGGSTTTLISAVLTDADDTWNNGTLFITHDAGGAGAAPENQSREIKDFTASSDTVEVRTAFTAATAVGDKFAIMKRRVSRADMISALNAAVRWYGPTPQEDETLTTEAETREYDIPAGVPPDKIYSVEIATQSASEYDYVPVSYNQRELEAGKLVLDTYPAYPYKLRLRFTAFPAEVDDDADTLSEFYFRDALVEYAIGTIMERRVQRAANPSQSDQSKMNYAFQKAESLKRAHPLPTPQYKIKRRRWLAPTNRYEVTFPEITKG